jgi:sulfoxide reductase heme-binding subunit YedZ
MLVMPLWARVASAAAAAAIHFVMVVKSWQVEPLVYASLVALLLGYRLAVYLRRPPARGREKAGNPATARPLRSPA